MGRRGMATVAPVRRTSGVDIAPRRTAREVVTFFAAYDGRVARWIAAMPQSERAQMIETLDHTLGVHDRRQFEDRCHELLARRRAAPIGSAEEESLEEMLWMLGYESERLFGVDVVHAAAKGVSVQVS
ncbi:MAG: hypothetical protein LC733_12260 [Actinobacteria bacterium]|nr:hypothetical protein [Actinomycetota bacterium]